MKGTYKPPMIGSFEDIGKDIVREAVKAPVDIAGQALESLGTGKPTKQKSTTTKGSSGQVVEEIGQTNDQKVKKAMARRALEELAGGEKKKEPTVWDEKQKEEAEKNRIEKEKKEMALKQSLPTVSPKAKRGNLYGIKAKKMGSEVGKNVKAE